MSARAKKPIVVIAGSGLGEKLGAGQAERRVVNTSFGKIPVLHSSWGDREVFAVQRHGDGHTTPPHKVNYPGIVSVAKEVGAEAIFASNAVGTMDTTRYPVESLALGKDLLPWQLSLNGGPVTFFDSFPNGPVHTDFSKPFNARLNLLLMDSASDLNLSLIPGASVVTTSGPRYETAAEIRTFQSMGMHLAGMTTAYEAILAGEQGTPYAAIFVITNPCTGISGNRLSHEEVKSVFARRADDLVRLFTRAFETM